MHPVLDGSRSDVLVLGAGDGLALREVLRYPDVESVTLVELDPAVVRLARTEPRLRELNAGAFDDPRVRLVHTDAFGWLRDAADRFDAVIVDLPDPDETATAKLYSVEFYTLVRAVLADGARVVVQSGSPYFAQKSYWSIEASLREAGSRPRRTTWTSPPSATGVSCWRRPEAGTAARRCRRRRRRGVSSTPPRWPRRRPSRRTAPGSRSPPRR